MCGIVGVVTAFRNGFTHAEVDVFKDMLYVDTLRGWDSTGVFGVDKYSNVGIHKAAIPGPAFIHSKEFTEFKGEAYRTGTVIVGHNRAATRGTVNDHNAHPFWVNDKIVLVQNGTYKGDHKHLKDTEVDTEAIAHVIHDEPDIEKALQKVNAAYALVWYNTETHCLHLIRNYERPLYIADTKNGGIVFASEIETILWACSRAKVALKEEPKLLASDTLMTVKFSKDNHTVDMKKIDNSYKHTSRGVPFRSNHHGYHASNDGDVGVDEDGYDGILRRSMERWRGKTQQHPGLDEPSMSAEGRNVDVSRTFMHYVVTELDQFHSGETVADDNARDINHRAALADRDGDKQLVEVLDYKPCNGQKDCRMWFIYGTVLDPRMDDKIPPVVVYWIRKGTEEEILEYTTVQFYRVKPSSARSHTFLNDENVRRYAVSCFGYEPEPVVMEEVVNVQ